MRNQLNNIHCEAELTGRRSLSGLLCFVCTRCDVTALCASKQGTKTAISHRGACQSLLATNGPSHTTLLSELWQL